MLFGGLTAANAQTARDLYVGYGSSEQAISAPTNNTANNIKVPKKGKPGTKVVIERMRGGKLAFVSPNSKFRSGDKIRLRFATNFDGYVKILNVGSSGKVNVLFPYEGADDRIQPTKDFQIPQNGDWIVFDDTPGVEMLTVMMSSKPLDFQNEDELRNAGKQAAASRDLSIQSDADATYAVATEESLQKPIGFTLQLKHQ